MREGLKAMGINSRHTFYATFFVRRHIAGGANCTLISALSPPRLCRTGTCRRLQTE